MSWIDGSRWFLHDGRKDDADALVMAHHYSRRPAGMWHYTAHDCGGLFGDFGPAFAVCSFGLGARAFSEQVVELVRLVLAPSHAGFPLTSLISKSCAAMRKAGHDLAVSYADKAEGHHGGVYQAASWSFHGTRYGSGTIANGSTTPSVDGFVIDGSFVPRRTCNARYGTSSVSALQSMLGHRRCVPHYDAGKLLYWKPLNRAGKHKARRIGLKSNPYPKPGEQQEEAA